MASTTIRDVARAAGVSVSTVSLVLNRPERVSPGTRDKVLAAADALGFVPAAEAVARARRAGRRIGVLGPFTAYPAATRRLSGLLRAARGQAVEPIVFDQPAPATSTTPLLASLPRTGLLDGLIVVSLPLDDAVAARIGESELPTVLLDVRHAGLSSVRTDDAAGGRAVAEHLLARGHTRFGFLGEEHRSAGYASATEQRLAGFRAALAGAGHDTAVRWTERSLPAATAAAAELLDRSDPPTAVFGADDLLAAAVLRAGHALGRSVPAELAVVGFDDTEVAAVLDLSTVRQPLEDAGRLAFELLLRRLREPGPAQDVLLDLTMVGRGST